MPDNKVRRFKLKDGKFRENGVRYKKGQIVKSLNPLDEMFPNKFDDLDKPSEEEIRPMNMSPVTIEKAAPGREVAREDIDGDPIVTGDSGVKTKTPKVVKSQPTPEEEEAEAGVVAEVDAEDEESEVLDEDAEAEEEEEVVADLPKKKSAPVKDTKSKKKGK